MYWKESEDQRRERTAYHEAGHWLVAYLRHFEVRCVRIRREGRFAGSVEVGYPLCDPTREYAATLHATDVAAMPPNEEQRASGQPLAEAGVDWDCIFPPDLSPNIKGRLIEDRVMRLMAGSLAELYAGVGPDPDGAADDQRRIEALIDQMRQISLPGWNGYKFEVQMKGETEKLLTDCRPVLDDLKKTLIEREVLPQEEARAAMQEALSEHRTPQVEQWLRDCPLGCQS